MSASVRRSRRRSVVALALCLLGVLVFVPSAQANIGHDQRFLIVSTNPSEDATPAVLGFGQIHAKGVDKVVSDTKDVFMFPKGSLFVTHEPQSSKDFQDPKTCLDKFSENGAFWVTGGTGAYKGASGSGSYHVDVLVIGCDQNSLPDVFTQEVKAVGSLHY